MGIFSFFKDAGKKLLGSGNDDEAIKNEIESSFDGEPVQGLAITVNDGEVVVAGVAQDSATREKVILIAGNVEGVDSVNADQLITLESVEATNERDIPEPTFYTIEKGATLWAIASSHYGDGNKYHDIVAANIEVIKDADKIYPGQSIRLPELV